MRRLPWSPRRRQSQNADPPPGDPAMNRQNHFSTFRFRVARAVCVVVATWWGVSALVVIAGGR
jgi:hypothetical protein